MKRAADAMAEADLLIVEAPELSRDGRGRRPESAYRLPDSERARLEDCLDRLGDPGTLRDGLQLVFIAIAGSQLTDFLEVVTEPDAAPQMSWAAILDGEPQECLVAFEGPTAPQSAMSLVAVLTRLSIPCRRATVAQMAIGHRFIGDAKRVTRLASRVAIRRETRRASAG